MRRDPNPHYTNIFVLIRIVQHPFIVGVGAPKKQEQEGHKTAQFRQKHASYNVLRVRFLQFLCRKL